MRIELIGSVDSQYQRGLAESVVADLPGVARVDNRIDVRTPPPLGDRVTYEAPTTARVLRRTLDDRGIDDSGIRIRVDDDVVTLTGHVEDRTALEGAVRSAYAAGAAHVESSLSLEP